MHRASDPACLCDPVCAVITSLAGAWRDCVLVLVLVLAVGTSPSFVNLAKVLAATGIPDLPDEHKLHALPFLPWILGTVIQETLVEASEDPNGLDNSQTTCRRVSTTGGMCKTALRQKLRCMMLGKVFPFFHIRGRQD